MTTSSAAEQLFACEAEGAKPAPGVGSPAGRDRVFRPYDPAESFLLPPSIDDWLPEDHEARFISEAPPYDPTMMLKLLLWGYSCGVTSSCEMERRCATDVAFRFLSARHPTTARSPGSAVGTSLPSTTCSSRCSPCAPRRGS